MVDLFIKIITWSFTLGALSYCVAIAIGECKTKFCGHPIIIRYSSVEEQKKDWIVVSFFIKTGHVCFLVLSIALFIMFTLPFVF